MTKTHGRFFLHKNEAQKKAWSEWVDFHVYNWENYGWVSKLLEIVVALSITQALS